MADTKLTDLTELAAQPAVGDWLYIVDVSNTSDDASGSSRKILAKYFAATDGNASGVTITGGGTIALAGYTLTAPATGTVVLTAATQTLTNKTLTSPTINAPKLVLPVYTSAQIAGLTATAGQIVFCSTTTGVYWFDGTNWKGVVGTHLF